MSNPPTVKLPGELVQAGTPIHRPGRLKWGDVVLKCGIADLPAWSLLTLRAGQTFSMEVPSQATVPAMLAELNDAVARRVPLDLAVGGTTSSALRRVTKVEAITIKQKVTGGAPVVEIQLRKL